MDDFKVIYRILDILHDAMDGWLDKRALSAEELGVSEAKRIKLMKMLQKEGYIDGLKITAWHLGQEEANIDDLELTLSGLDYLENNDTMHKVYHTLKGIHDIVK